jgi:hypothetical protein
MSMHIAAKAKQSLLQVDSNASSHIKRHSESMSHSHEVATAAQMRGTCSHHCIGCVSAAAVAAFSDCNIWHSRLRVFDIVRRTHGICPDVLGSDVFASEYSALLARRLLESSSFDIEDELKKVSTIMRKLLTSAAASVAAMTRFVGRVVESAFRRTGLQRLRRDDQGHSGVVSTSVYHASYAATSQDSRRLHTQVSQTGGVVASIPMSCKVPHTPHLSLQTHPTLTCTHASRFVVRFRLVV